LLRAAQAVLHPGLFRGERVLVLGLGETGVAVVRWVLRQGGQVRLCDTRSQPPGLEQLGELSVELHLGRAVWSADLLEGVTRVVPGPGLNPRSEPLASLLAEARRREIVVDGEIELFAQALRRLQLQRRYRPMVLGVTGTNGKTTVTALTGHLLRGAGLSVGVAGNISPPALQALMQALDADSLPEVWVLELSSFQLANTRSLKLDAGVVLNLTQDHLDWHGSMQAYAQAKARLLQMSALAVVNRQDALVMGMIERLDEQRVRSFGLDLPRLVGDLGILPDKGIDWLCEVQPDDLELPAPTPTDTPRKRRAPLRPRQAGRLQRLMPADALQIAGRHNQLNAQAALLLARAVGPGWSRLLGPLQQYAGEPHRLQFVRSVAGIDCIDDSKGTNVGATVAALEGLGRRCVLIAGGQGKGQDFEPLAAPVARHARAVMLLGQDRETIAAALSATGVPLHRVDSIEQAVRQGIALAQPGDVLLLSPACASLDMFRSYAHRAAAFVAAVDEVALDRGELA
jgi:UDP-N-acetylmuramoylalanine--D-glutamate ligase